MTSRTVRPHALRYALLLLALSFAVPSPAAAYVDPLSGSILLQVLAAGFLAASFTLKRYWQRVAGAFRGIRERRTQR